MKPRNYYALIIIWAHKWWDKYTSTTSRVITQYQKTITKQNQKHRKDVLTSILCKVYRININMIYHQMQKSSHNFILIQNVCVNEIGFCIAMICERKTFMKKITEKFSFSLIQRSKGFSQYRKTKKITLVRWNR